MRGFDSDTSSNQRSQAFGDQLCFAIAPCSCQRVDLRGERFPDKERTLPELSFSESLIFESSVWKLLLLGQYPGFAYKLHYIGM